MTIDEAIAHAREVAEIHRNNDKLNKTLGKSSSYYNTDCIKCAEEHEQLAEWLEELKALRNGLKIKCDSLNDALEKGKNVGYNKAIDDAKDVILQTLDNEILVDTLHLRLEQLKAGAK